MNRDLLHQRLIEDEGTGPIVNGRLMPYRDTVGKWSIGIGRNLTDCGISHDEALLLLDNDLDACISDLAEFPWFGKLSQVRQCAVISLRFNVGPGKFRGFKKMLKALDREDYPGAASELRDSAWYEQVGKRGATLVRMLATGALLLLLAVPAFAQNPVADDLTEARRLYPTPMSPTEIGELLTGVVARHPGWVLLAKPNGNHCPTPLGVFIACDYLIDASNGQGYDVLRDQEGVGAVQWSPGERFTSDRFVYPVKPPPASVPHTGTTVPNSGTDLDALLDLIGDVQATANATLDRATATLDRANAIYDQNERMFAQSNVRLDNIASLIAARSTVGAPITVPNVIPTLPVLTAGEGSTLANILKFTGKYVLPIAAGYLSGTQAK